ncbi:MAG: aminoacyl-histidine dipeptidase [Candidatus Riflebacteria bacterium]|nr:aminoacyl-histidine dipeptidase [Candidatus Riflebacteria bacterium]
MTTAIHGLTPHVLWEQFAKISAIPRPSGNESRVAEYIIDLAHSKGLEAIQDDTGNVIVRKPASPGRERSPGVVLHAHMDMVCEKDGTSKHDFDQDGIRLKRVENHITADGTTLGADNGIGVAAALAVMLDQSVVHGPMECLFTVDEEVGFSGILNLSPGVLRGSVLLNLDTDAEGMFCVGCAGGGDSLITLPVRLKEAPKGYVPLLLNLRGLKGGHSGLDIHRGRGNALKVMGRVLLHASQSHDIRLSSITSGAKANVIPREAEALVQVRSWQLRPFRKTLDEIQGILRDEYALKDPGVTLEISTIGSDTGARVLKRADEGRLVSLLYAIPHGVVSMSARDPRLVETSSNLASVRTEDDSITLLVGHRGSVKTALEDAMMSIMLAGKLAGATVLNRNRYPAWRPNFDSAVLSSACDTYRELFRRDPLVVTTHGGLECGVVSDKYPDMDILSFGPTVEGVHSPRERVEIGSVQRFWTFLLTLLKNLS